MIGLAHDKTKLFECPTCKATYASAKTLNKHVAFVHNQNSGHLCNLCGKQFQWKASLKVKNFIEPAMFCFSLGLLALSSK